MLPIYAIGAISVVYCIIWKCCEVIFREIRCGGKQRPEVQIKDLRQLIDNTCGELNNGSKVPYERTSRVGRVEETCLVALLVFSSLLLLISYHFISSDCWLVVSDSKACHTCCISISQNLIAEGTETVDWKGYEFYNSIHLNRNTIISITQLLSF
jgi:hypothetical protein